MRPAFRNLILAGATFVPTQIAGLRLWLDGSDTTTITLSSTALTQWNDKSGNGFNVTQGTSANRPTILTANRNGNNAVNFGATQWMDGGTGLLSGSDPMMEAFITMNPQSLAANRVYFETGPNAQANQESYRLLALTTGEMYFSNIGNDRDTTTGVVVTSAWALYHWSVNTGAMSSSNPLFYKNNVNKASFGGTGTLTPNLQASSIFRVGGRLGGTSGDAQAIIGEVLIYQPQGQFDSGTRQKIYDYLNTKWGPFS